MPCPIRIGPEPTRIFSVRALFYGFVLAAVAGIVVRRHRVELSRAGIHHLVHRVDIVTYRRISCRTSRPMPVRARISSSVKPLVSASLISSAVTPGPSGERPPSESSPDGRSLHLAEEPAVDLRQGEDVLHVRQVPAKGLRDAEDPSSSQACSFSMSRRSERPVT